MSELSSLAIIPARKGSKAVPGKNLKPLAGKPLIAYSIDTAFQCNVFDEIVVSTDCEKIAQLSMSKGCNVPFMRPAQLASDKAAMIDVVIHAINFFEEHIEQYFDLVAILQPTSPLRNKEDVASAINTLKQDLSIDSVVSVSEIPSDFSPFKAMKIEKGKLKNFLPAGEKVTRRQDVQPTYTRDGSVFAFRRQLLESGTIYGENCKPLVVQNNTINIDTIEDFEFANYLINEKYANNSSPSLNSGHGLSNINILG